MIVVYQDHPEQHVVVGDVWFSELIEGYWRFQNVSPLRQKCWRCWNQCFPSSVTRSNLSSLITIFEMTIFLHCVLCFLPVRFPWAIVISDMLFFLWHRSPRSIGRTEFFLWLTNNLLSYGSHRAIFDWFGEIGVGLEEPGWSVSPSDCWTRFSTGRCSTVEPNSLFPLVQLRSRLKEIFGGGRGDRYCFSYNFLQFSIFQLLQWNSLEVFLEG